MDIRGLACLVLLGGTVLFGQDAYDFGTKGNREAIAHDFTLRNLSSSSVEIVSVRSSCSCGAAAVGERVIPPGGAGVVHCSLEPKSLEGKVAKSFWVSLRWMKGRPPAAASVAAGAGELGLKGEETEIVLRMSGVIKARVRLSLQEALFTRGESSLEVRLLGEARQATVAGVKAPADSRFAFGLMADRRGVRISPKGPLPVGSWVEQWEVLVNDQAVKSLPLVVRSLSAGGIQAFPDTVYVRGRRQRRQVVFRSADRGLAFRITAARLEPGGMALTPMFRKGVGWTVYLEEDVQDALPENARIVVTTDLPSVQTIVVPVQKIE